MCLACSHAVGVQDDCLMRAMAWYHVSAKPHDVGGDGVLVLVRPNLFTLTATTFAHPPFPPPFFWSNRIAMHGQS